ncbi:arylesterase [Desulfonema ishimotonii]|uniref:Arylesterase n=1 Tax=Desulfonema ishimotonii TaxID=45657 RepID=A0A401FTJ4_9BACT|nr:arylesterase [Desulfonema ishimotonii]GBC60285.1 arylesterase [Desulfonema ishimotonii]
MRIRRISLAVVVMMFTLFFSGCEQKQEPAAQRDKPAEPVYEGTVVAVGDSLTEGYGLEEEQAYPALLGRKLNSSGYGFRVINAGISGETSSGTLSRVRWILTLKPDIVILETGANDGLRGIDPQLTRKNIDEIIRILGENNVIVVLAGMQMVRNMGAEYTAAFAEIYPALARKHGLIFIPFFLRGVAGEARLSQADGIHPTPEGYQRVADTVYPCAVKAIGRLRSRKTG